MRDRRGAASLCKRPFSVDLENTVYALDTTTIDLSLKVFPWAQSRTTSRVKMHTQIDLRGNSFIYPCFRRQNARSERARYDNARAGSFTIMDRGFLICTLYRLTQAGRFLSSAPKAIQSFGAFIHDGR